MFIGIRNRYCADCQRAENKGIPKPKHTGTRINLEFINLDRLNPDLTYLESTYLYRRILDVQT